VAERTALNLVRHLSGVATHSARWVEALSGTGAGLLDTRFTTPGLRPVERYAVRCGGGTNGRAGLYDAAHVTAEHSIAAGSVAEALDAVRRRLPGALVQVDVRTTLQAVEAVHAGARFVVCENMRLELLEATVRQIRAATAEHVEIAATGGFDLESATAVARTGVDHLYVDSLVHDSTVLQVGLTIA
jgi:nicotinate-nucleotide pyrophosphorylase (carboxylating)